MNKPKIFNIKGIVTILFLGVIVFFFFTILIKFVCSNILGIEITNESPLTQENEKPVAYDWSNDYPFDSKLSFDFSDDTATPKDETAIENASKTSKYVSVVTDIEDKVDSYSNNLLFGRMKFVELNASINNAIGMKLVTGTDSVVVKNNGYLTYLSSEVDTTYAAQSTKWFSDYLKEKGINFVYVQSPSKENEIDNELPKGIIDYCNINANSLLNSLNDTGVNTLDLRPLLNAEFDDWYSCFFKTDHHWKPETGVWAAGKITEYLNDKFSSGIDESLGDIDNYNIDVYENYSLGSQGKKITLKYCEPENFSIVYPKSSTLFTVDYDGKMTITGPYNKALLDMSRMEKIDYYSTSTYSAYLYGNKSVIKIHNDNLSNGKRILFIADSFSRCVVPSLALGVEYLDVLDLRHFGGSVINYIEKYNPNTVIVNYNPTTISDTKNHYSPFNFE